MDPISATKQTAESITNFGLLVVLAAICIVGAGLAIFVLVRLVNANYRKLEIRVCEQRSEIDELKNGSRVALERQLQMNTNVLREFCRVIAQCPGARRLDPDKLLNGEVTP